MLHSSLCTLSSLLLDLTYSIDIPTVDYNMYTIIVQRFNRASIQAGNKEDILSVDFGLRDWDERDSREVVRKYREFVYEKGAVDAGPVKCSGAALSRNSGTGFNRAGKGAVIDQKVVEKERKRKYRVSRTDRFRYRSRYFTDSGIIGSKAFVGEAPVKWKEILRGKSSTV